MRIHSTAFAAVLAIVPLLGCTATPRPLDIGVSDDGFVVDGHALKTQAELTNAIRLSGATACRVRPEPTVAYRQVASAMLAIRQTGCHPGLMGSVAPSP